MKRVYVLQVSVFLCLIFSSDAIETWLTSDFHIKRSYSSSMSLYDQFMYTVGVCHHGLLKILYNDYQFSYRRCNGRNMLMVYERAHFTHRGNTQGDIFDEILQGKEKARFLCETKYSIAFLTRNREKPGHYTASDAAILIIPQRHEDQFHKLTKAEWDDLVALGVYIATELGAADAFELFLNNGVFQTIYHVHLHLVVKGVELYDKLPLQTIAEWRANKTEWRLDR